MDSPELRYLKAAHEVNRKFYTYAVLEFAFLQATVAALAEIVNTDISVSRGVSQDASQHAFLAKVAEYRKDFESDARSFLATCEILETGSENN